MQFKSKQILLERFSLDTAELMANYGQDVPVSKDMQLLDAELLDAEGRTQNCVPENGLGFDSQLQKSLVKCLGIGATVGELFPIKKS